MQIAHSLEVSARAAGRAGRLGPYLAILAVGSGARVFGLAAQLVVLVILSRMLSKDSFGDMMTAFGFYRIAASALGVGASLVLLYHVSRRPEERAEELRLHRYSAVLSGGVATLIALFGFILADPLAQALDKPGVAVWFRALAPFAIFSTLLVTSTGALEGRSRISESIALAEVAPNAVRIVLLPAVAWLKLPDQYVADAMTLSVLIPWLWTGRHLWSRSAGGWRRWTGWDLGYCGKFVAATLFANQLGAVDILVAGVLFPSGTVADYALATRIAALYSFFQLALLKRFAPRAARLIEAHDLVGLRREFVLCRKLVVGCCALTIAGLLCVAPLVLPLFGNFSGAGAFIIWLAIPTFIQSFYATSDRLLIISGHANLPLALTASSFGMLVATPFVTAPFIGATALPAAMMLSVLLFNPIMAARVNGLFGIGIIEPADLMMMVAGTIALAAYALTGAVAAGGVSIVVLAAIALYCCGTAIRRISA